MNDFLLLMCLVMQKKEKMTNGMYATLKDLYKKERKRKDATKKKKKKTSSSMVLFFSLIIFVR